MAIAFLAFVFGLITGVSLMWVVRPPLATMGKPGIVIPTIEEKIDGMRHVYGQERGGRTVLRKK